MEKEKRLLAGRKESRCCFAKHCQSCHPSLILSLFLYRFSLSLSLSLLFFILCLFGGKKRECGWWQERKCLDSCHPSLLLSFLLSSLPFCSLFPLSSSLSFFLISSLDSSLSSCVCDFLEENGWWQESEGALMLLGSDVLPSVASFFLLSPPLFLSLLRSSSLVLSLFACVKEETTAADGRKERAKVMLFDERFFLPSVASSLSLLFSFLSFPLLR